MVDEELNAQSNKMDPELPRYVPHTRPRLLASEYLKFSFILLAGTRISTCHVLVANFTCGYE